MNRRTVLMIFLAGCFTVAHAQAEWTMTSSKLTGIQGHGLYDIAYGNGRFVATLPYLAYSSAIWSEDGETWHATAMAGPRFGGEIQFVDGWFYQLCDNGIWRSVDGDQWQLVKAITLHGELGHNHFATSGTSWMITVSSSDGTLLFSPDLTSVVTTAPLPNTGQAGSTVDTRSVSYFSGRFYVHYFVLSSSGYVSYVASTADNHTWTLVTELNTASEFIAAGGKILAMVGANLLSSTNGTNFVSRATPTGFGGPALRYEGGRYFSGEKLIASTDGNSWAPLAAMTLPPLSGISNLAYGNGRFVAVGTVPGSSGSLSNTDVVALLDASGPPTISRQPQNFAATAGQSVNLAVSAAGGGLNYQWTKDGVTIPGATTTSLSWPAIMAVDAGDYRVTISNAWGSITSSPVSVTVSPANPPRLVNFSLRAIAAEGDRTLTVGFALDGVGTKPLLIRGIGPGLVGFGVSGTLADPRLGVYEGSTQTFTNDNWSVIDGHTFRGFELTPGSKDAVISANFTARTYTTQVTGAPGTSGEALTELYDADVANTTVRLVNLSARTSLGDGQRLIVGCTIAGDAPKAWVIRAVGPTLVDFGLSTAHADPRMELYSGSTKIVENDQWTGDDGRTSGAFPLPVGSKDAVIVRTLSPGGYTIHVVGPAGTSGVILVEIYEVR